MIEFDLFLIIISHDKHNMNKLSVIYAILNFIIHLYITSIKIIINYITTFLKYIKYKI